MKDKFEIFSDIVKKSVKKNGKGEYLTLGHLSNIITMTEKLYKIQEDNYNKLMDDVYNECIDEHWGDNSE